MIGTGWVGSAGVHIYLAAQKERRFCTENTRFLIHQPSGGSLGTAADIAIDGSPVRDLAVGVALTLPVFWLFTMGLGLTLPPLVNAWI